ncbi:MAG: beta-ketoacyl-ACP synthase [Notoacmeibacter sp.]
MAHEVVITGVGLVSSIGVGFEAHLDALNSSRPTPVFDADTHSPIIVHAAPDIDFSLQIPKREQRQMELWQKLGVYGAGLALDQAGIKGNDDLCKTMDMVVAAGGGERDLDVDAEIIARVAAGQNAGDVINSVLTNDLRPTLFLAQLSNLLAGNISIVHKVTGSSRTFMGEESAGVSALKSTVSRIRHGQSTHALVGGSYNGQDADMILNFELAGLLKRDGWQPIWKREGKAGIIPGSGSAFLVLEERGHAEKRGANILAVIGNVEEGRTKRDAFAVDKISAIFANASSDFPTDLIISGASGEPASVALEKEILGRLKQIPVRAFSSLTGYLKEPQFVFSVCLAALALSQNTSFSAFDETENSAGKGPNSVLAQTIGALRGEGAVLLRKA